MEEYLECGVCFERFSNDRVPLILDCGHTYCSVCLSKMLSLTGEVACPVDRTLYLRPMSDLKRNISLLQIINSKSHKSKLPKCLNHASKCTRFMCIDCKTHFCSRCLSLHNFHQWLDTKNFNQIKEYIDKKLQIIQDNSDIMMKTVQDYSYYLNKTICLENQLKNNLQTRCRQLRQEIEYAEYDCLNKIQVDCGQLRENIVYSINYIISVVENITKSQAVLESTCKENIIAGVPIIENTLTQFLQAARSLGSTSTLEKAIIDIKDHYYNF